MSEPDNRLILIDGHALLYRAFFAFPTLTTKSGLIVNAIYGFTRVLLSVIKDQNPKYLAVAFDTPKPTFRHTQFVGYKAQRKEMPEELQGQIDGVKEIVKVLNIPQFSIDGFEADDVIGTLAKNVTAGCKEGKPGTHVLIVTGDKDAFQLVNDCIHVLVPPHGKQGEQEFDPAAVEAKMGVKPDQIVDYKALSGDPSDNIPGIAGIGPKTAVRLLQEYDTLDNLYQEIKDKTNTVQNSKVLKNAVLTKVVEGYESAKLSQMLAQIDTAVPIKINLDDCRVSGYDKAKTVEKFNEFEFNSLIKYLPPDEVESLVMDSLF
ncbi:MAG: 5'-3' exonuclease H3TH domain-containing protein [Patescibacteria group bacterium]